MASQNEGNKINLKKKLFNHFWRFILHISLLNALKALYFEEQVVQPSLPKNFCQLVAFIELTILFHEAYIPGTHPGKGYIFLHYSQLSLSSHQYHEDTVTEPLQLERS